MKIEISPGDNIKSACVQAVHQAKIHNCTVEFDFNGQTIVATDESDSDALTQAYLDESNRRAEAYHASPEYKKLQEEMAQKERARETSLADALAGAPEHMTLRDADGWAKAVAINTDPYGAAVMTYAERWARLMEVRMSKGERIADIADQCSHLADSEGITGFMYGCAVSVLSQVWIHGEALRLWHNKNSQIGSEGDKANDNGGVLNPALLCIVKK